MIKDNIISDPRKVVPFGRSSQFYFNRAMYEYEKGNLTRVRELLKSAITYNPDDIWNYYNLALTYEELGEFDNAIMTWVEEVLKRDDQFSEAYFHLAVCYAETEDIDLVYKYMEKYLTLEPNGDLESAARHIMKLLEDSRSGTETVKHTSDSSQTMLRLEKKLASMINAHAYDEAVRICEETLANEGESLPLLNRTALICILAGEDQKGLDYINRILTIDKSNIGAYCSLLFFHSQNGDDVRVQSIIEKVHDIEFASLNEVLRWTQTLGNIGKHRRAYEWLRDIYWSGEYSAEMLYQLGVAALNLNKYKEAKDFWRQAALLDDMRSPAELYHQLLLQTESVSEIVAISSYNYDWPLLDSINSDGNQALASYTDSEKRIIFVCMQFYLRYGTEDIVNMVFNYLPILESDMKVSIIQELMLSAYDDMKYHILQEYDPHINNISALKSKEATYLFENNFKVKVTVPFLVTARMIKENLETYSSTVLVKVGQKLWYSYCNRSHPNPRRISKSTVWAAAVECIVLEMFNFDCDYNSITRRYGIKGASMMRAIEQIKEVVIG